jgi:hypothetical protein
VSWRSRRRRSPRPSRPSGRLKKCGKTLGARES